jgi:surfeit locus 1 family protein
MADAAGASPPSPPGERRPNFVFFAAVLIALAILVALGAWQVRRLHWKEALVSTIENRMRQPPVALDIAVDNWQKTGDVDYLPLRLEGTFRHEDEQHYLATHKGQSGWYVYTPLQTPDGRTVIINRGFVPYDQKDAAARPWQPVAGTIALEGLARNPLQEKPGWLVPENTPADRIWYWKDFPAMAAAMRLDQEKLVPFFVDLARTDADNAVGPIGGVTRIVLPNRHLQYAVTWFGLAAALVVIAGFVVWRGSRRPKF